jgi:hypothetical protein
MKSAAEVDMGPVGQSRRSWIATSAALVAGSLAGCNARGRADSSGDNSTFPPSLPSFDAERSTNRLTPTVGPEEDRFVAWNEALRASAAGRESAFVDLTPSITT